MKINFTDVDMSQFMMHQHIINGEVCTLIQPQHIGTKWSQQNKIFRSSLWNSNGELISAGFLKFTNWGENPDNFPVPTSLKNTTVVEKIDGSLLIVSKYKGQYILRTRGTSDATVLDNGHELEIFRKKYLSKIVALCLEDTWDYSFLFEWVSPENRIVIRYGDQPEWYLVGYIIHDTYSLLAQDALHAWQLQIGCPRPATYTFPSVEELMKDIEGWKGKEGVCVYSNNGQTIHKAKAAEYLIKHRMKEEFSSLEKVVDFFVHEGYPSWQDFQSKVSQVVDYETATEMVGDISRICDAYKEVLQIVSHMKVFVEPLKALPRKDAAMKILSSYGGMGNNRASFCFKILDNKPLQPDDIKKLLFQVLKK